MSWPIKKLGEVCDVLIGGTPRRGTEKYWKNGVLPWVAISDLSKSGKIITETEEKITKIGAEESNVKLLPEGTLLFSFKLSIGKLAFAGMDLYTNEAIAGLKVKNLNELDSSYLYYLLQQFTFTTTQKAVKGNTLNKEKIINLDIPLPLILTQKKIVKKIEELFAKIDEAKSIRESAVKDSVNMMSATFSKIFEEGRQRGWDERALGEICEIARGGSPRPIKDYLTNTDDGVNWIKISDATSSTKYIYKTREKIIKEGLKKTRLVKPGDFILTNSMSFGRPYIMKTTGAIHDGWLLLRPNKSIMEEYLYYFLSSDEIYRQFTNLAGGAVVQNLNSELVRGVKILIPPLAEQKKIVSQLDALTQKVRELQALQAETSSDLVALKESILHKAFQGELV